MRKDHRCGFGRVCLVFILIICIVTGAFAAVNAVWPDASGDDVEKDGSLVVDCSHMDEGYIMAKGPKTDKRLKLRITFDDTNLNYDLNNDGEYEVFPLQFGSGKYTVGLYKNVSGKKYSSEGTVKLKVTEDDNAPFLCPNQYVNYTDDSEAVKQSDELCAGLETDKDKFNAIWEYLKGKCIYDYIKAATVQTGTLPDIDGTYETGMGICQDFAALMACMLRVQGIPAKVVIGYCNNNYHAWNEVLIDGEYTRVDLTAVLTGIPSTAQYTTERIY